MTQDNYLPTISEYSKNLSIASSKFNLTIDECRNRFGLYTNKQWFNLLND